MQILPQLFGKGPGAMTLTDNYSMAFEMAKDFTFWLPELP
jgi:hypothetical protein